MSCWHRFLYNLWTKLANRTLWVLLIFWRTFHRQDNFCLSGPELSALEGRIRWYVVLNQLTLGLACLCSLVKILSRTLFNTGSAIIWLLCDDHEPTALQVSWRSTWVISWHTFIAKATFGCLSQNCVHPYLLAWATFPAVCMLFAIGFLS